MCTMVKTINPIIEKLTSDEIAVYPLQVQMLNMNAAVWSLYQTYRRTDDDRGESYELGQSTVKCMRGILQCWIKQACRVEFFKQRQSNQYALHTQMITSGLQIIYTQDEVAIIQNLVYYVERAYRTPD
uniref:Phosphorylase b kinase regulatory subunit n=1 Tax=Glossina palpalis gambiensis TaxID=67801 RepID=A0A1B0APT6_9MUSC